MSRLGGVGFSGYNMSVPTAMSSRDRSLAELLETLRRNTALQHDSAERKKDRKFQEKQQKKAEKAAKKKQLTGLAIGAGAGIAGGAILGAAMAPAAAAAVPAAEAGTTAATTAGTTAATTAGTTAGTTTGTASGASLVGTPVAGVNAAATAPTTAPGILGASGVPASLTSTTTTPSLASTGIPASAFTPAAAGHGIGGPGIVGGGVGAQEAFAAKYAALNGLSAPTATGAGASTAMKGAVLGGGVGGGTGYSTSPPPAPVAPPAPTAMPAPRVPSRFESALVGGALGGLGAVSGQNFTGAYTGHLADMPLNAARIGLIGAQMGTENAQTQTELQRARKIGFEGDIAGYEGRHADQFYGGRALEAANQAATVLPLAEARIGRDNAAAGLSRMRGDEVGQRMRHADTMLPYEQDYMTARTGASNASAQLSGLRGRQIGSEMIRASELHPLKMRSESALGDARITGAMRNAASWYDTLNPLDGGKSTSNRYTQGPIEDQLRNRWGDVSTEGSGEDIAFEIGNIGAHEADIQGVNTEHGRRAAAATVAELRRLGAKDDDIPFLQNWSAEEGSKWEWNPKWLEKRERRQIQWTPR